VEGHRDTGRIERINGVGRSERGHFSRVEFPRRVGRRKEREAGQDSDDGERSASSGGWEEQDVAAQLCELYGFPLTSPQA